MMWFFSAWCNSNHLKRNISKTNDLELNYCDMLLHKFNKWEWIFYMWRLGEQSWFWQNSAAQWLSGEHRRSWIPAWVLSVRSLDVLPVSVWAAWALRFSPTIKCMHAVLLSSQRPRPEYWQRHKSGPQARHGGWPLVLSLGWVKRRQQRALCILYSIWPLRNC